MDTDTTMGHCTLGAINAASSELKNKASVKETAMRELMVATGLINIPEWNDANGTTQGDVQDALRHAAKEIRNSIPEESDEDSE